MKLHMNLGENSYDIVIEHGVLFRATEHLNLNRRVCVVTDSGVPAQYAAAVAAQCREARINTRNAVIHTIGAIAGQPHNRKRFTSICFYI